MKIVNHRSDCPVSFTLDFFGDRWAPLILRDIMFWHKSSFGEFFTSKEKIATNILGDRLNMLTNEGFLLKSISPVNKSKFIYTLTDKGIELIPLMVELLLWGSRYSTDASLDVFLVRINMDKEKFIQEIKDKILDKRRELLESLIVED